MHSHSVPCQAVESPEEAEALFDEYSGDDGKIDWGEFKHLWPSIKPDMP